MLKKMTTEELVRSRAENANFALIGVLPEERFASGHIPGSENVPLEAEDFVARVSRKVPGKKTKIVVYCEGGRCDASAKAASRLESSDFANVYDYQGGMRAWIDAGREVARGPSA